MLINENMNFLRRSIKGTLLFVSNYADRKRDSEKFENPEITNLKITIEGVANKAFDEGMRTMDQWKEAQTGFIQPCPQKFPGYSRIHNIEFQAKRSFQFISLNIDVHQFA